MPTEACFDTRFFYELFLNEDTEIVGKLREINRNCAKRHVSVITIHELTKELIEQKGKTLANAILKQIRMEYIVHDVTEDIAVRSAELRVHHKIPLADAVIAATGILIDVPTCTDDPHFSEMPKSRPFWLK